MTLIMLIFSVRRRYILKTFFRITFRILGKLTYLTTALLIASILTAGIFGGIGYHYYEGYYKDYMKVQQDWATVDNFHTEYINKVEEKFSILQKSVKDTKFASKEEKTEALNKVKFLEVSMRNAIHSMSYQEKFTSYPEFVNTTNDVLFLLSDNKSEEIIALGTELNGIEKSIIDSKKTYNKKAAFFNKQNEKFPENIIADIGSFHTWSVMP